LQEDFLWGLLALLDFLGFHLPLLEMVDLLPRFLGSWC
jgi:hypothetical protein